MKAAVNKHVTQKHLKEFKSEDGSVGVKYYQFIDQGHKDLENITPPPAAMFGNSQQQSLGMSFPSSETSPEGGLSQSSPFTTPSTSSNFAYQSTGMFCPTTPQPWSDQQQASNNFAMASLDAVSDPQYDYLGPLNSLAPNVMPAQQDQAGLHTPMRQPNLFNSVIPSPFPEISVTDQDFQCLPAHSDFSGFKYERCNVPNMQYQSSFPPESTHTKVEEPDTPVLMNLASFESTSTLSTPVVFQNHPNESFSLPLQGFSEMTIEPKANQQVFENFKLTDVESSFLDQTDYQILRKYQSVLLKLLTHASKPEKVTEMKITCLRKTDENDSEYLPKTKNIASCDGFRILSKDSVLGTPYEVSKFGPIDLECFKLPAPDQSYSEKVNKCLKTFVNSGIVFVWKNYWPPTDFTKLGRLCWRLYCYKICRGYPKNEAAETNKVQRLPMCLKTPLKEEAFELREHSFEVVFDVLKMCAVAARLGQQMVANGSEVKGQIEEENGKKLNIFLGLKSEKLFDDASLPVKLSLESPLVKKLFRSVLNHGRSSSDTNSSNVHNTSDAASVSTKDSTAGKQ